MQKALALEVARELNLSPELTHQVCKSFHDGIRELIKNPTNVKSGILIADFLTLRLSEKKLTKLNSKIEDEVLQKTLEQMIKHKRKNGKIKQT